MSCLFISLGKLLRLDPDQLRNDICDFMISNHQIEWNGTKLRDWIKMVAGDTYKSYNRYVNEMRNKFEWGGAPEIAVCCMMYNISVEVLHRQNGRLLEKILFEDETLKKIKGMKTRLSVQTLNDNVIFEQEQNEREKLLKRMACPIKKSRKRMRTIRPTLLIDWNGVHYEPIAIRNPVSIG